MKTTYLTDTERRFLSKFLRMALDTGAVRGTEALTIALRCMEKIERDLPPPPKDEPALNILKLNPEVKPK